MKLRFLFIFSVLSGFFLLLEKAPIAYAKDDVYYQKKLTKLRRLRLSFVKGETNGVVWKSGWMLSGWHAEKVKLSGKFFKLAQEISFELATENYSEKKAVILKFEKILFEALVTKSDFYYKAFSISHQKTFPLVQDYTTFMELFYPSKKVGTIHGQYSKKFRKVLVHILKLHLVRVPDFMLQALKGFISIPVAKSFLVPFSPKVKGSYFSSPVIPVDVYAFDHFYMNLVPYVKNQHTFEILSYLRGELAEQIPVLEMIHTQQFPEKREVIFQIYRAFAEIKSDIPVLSMKHYFKYYEDKVDFQKILPDLLSILSLKNLENANQLFKNWRLPELPHPENDCKAYIWDFAKWDEVSKVDEETVLSNDAVLVEE